MKEDDQSQKQRFEEVEAELARSVSEAEDVFSGKNRRDFADEAPQEEGEALKISPSALAVSLASLLGFSRPAAAGRTASTETGDLSDVERVQVTTDTQTMNFSESDSRLADETDEKEAVTEKQAAEIEAGEEFSLQLNGGESEALSAPVKSGSTPLVQTFSPVDIVQGEALSVEEGTSEGGTQADETATDPDGNGPQEQNFSSVSAVEDTNAAANTISENAAVGTRVGITARASDADIADSVRFYLVDGSGNVITDGPFAIDATTGVVTVADSSQLDYEAGTSVTLTVQATSTDGSTSTQTFTVNLTDVDEFDVTGITDTNSGTNVVSESAATGTLVGITASASDADGTDTVSYQLVDGSGNVITDGPFAIDATTGVVTVADSSQLDYEAGTSVTLTVQATSTDGSTSTQTFTVDLTDVDEFDVTAVTDSNSATNTVSESAATGTLVGITASASDADGTDSVSYQLVDGSGTIITDGPFAINATTGVVTVADSSQLDYEAGTSVTLTVQATSTDGSTSTQTFTVDLTDVDEFDVTGITDTNSGTNVVSESAATGTLVGITASASDADGTDTVSYQLVDGSGNVIVNGPFAIDATTGVVTVADSSQLDYEAGTSVTLTVQATSTDGSTSTQTFTVNLTDVDEFDVTGITDTNSGTNVVSESAATGTLVGITASASDADGTDTVSYQLVDGSGTVITDGPFAIDATTGVVTVADSSQLDYEAGTSVTLTVQATSTDGSTSAQTFTVNLTDADEFDVSAVVDVNAGANRVSEAAAAGTTVGITASASDADSTDSVTFRLVDANGNVVSNGPFAIDANTGVVTVAASSQLNYQSGTSVTLHVQAVSTDGSTSTQSFVVELEPSDVPPTGIIATFANDLTQPIGSGETIATLHAIDPDAWDSHTYRLVDDADGLFQINEQTGELSLRLSVEPEFTQQTGTTNSLNSFYQSGRQDTDISFADMDGDGDLDAFMSNINGTFHYYENTGTAENANFVARTGTANPLNGVDLGSYVYSTLADIDGDGDVDLIAQGSGGVLYMENTGSASSPNFVQRTGASNPFSGLAARVYGDPSFADMDGDGDLDLVMASWYGYQQTGQIYQYFENTGTETNPNYVERTGAANPFAGVTGNTYGRSTSLADLDQDGDIDLIVGDWLGGVSYYENVGGAENPDFVRQTGTANPFNYINQYYSTNVTLVDIDNDGQVEAFISESTSGGYTDIYFYENTSTDAAPVDLATLGTQTIVVEATDTSGHTYQETIDLTFGTAGNDTFTGGSNADFVHAGAGNDQITGGAGNDVIDGGIGNDVVYGGDGNDTFLHSLGDGNDTYHGGQGAAWTDTINLENSGGDIGEYGVDWTINITNGGIESVSDTEITFSDDTDGTIVLQDGSTINFHDMESVHFS